jgi:hypothetical protein
LGDRKKEIGQIISMVGEPLLRKKLKRLYGEINPDSSKTVEDLAAEEKSYIFPAREKK